MFDVLFGLDRQTRRHGLLTKKFSCCSETYRQEQEDREVEKSERTENFDHFPVAAVEALGFVLLSHCTQAHKLDAKGAAVQPKVNTCVCWPLEGDRTPPLLQFLSFSFVFI